jgi:hypothetical protein
MQKIKILIETEEVRIQYEANVETIPANITALTLKLTREIQTFENLTGSIFNVTVTDKKNPEPAPVKEQLLVEEPKKEVEVNTVNYDKARPAPLGNHRSQGLGDPFQGTSWGVNK